VEQRQGVANPSANEVDAATDALCDYSLSIPAAVPSYEMAMQEFPWRNGFFLSQAATPLHLHWLRLAGTPKNVTSKYAKM
jgi:hypothetical protein